LDRHPQAAWLLGRRRRNTRRLATITKKDGQLSKLLRANREDDKKQLGNALIAWAMLTAIEIEAELGWASPDHEHTPRHPDLLIKTLEQLRA